MGPEVVPVVFDLTTITNLIQNMGFPIFVCIWLLFRSDKKEEATQAILLDLKTAITNFCIQQDNSKPGV
jgi:hypothetical protein